MASKNINILSLPSEILESVLLYCSYDEISKCRLVCHQFNEVCKQLLNQGFTLVDRQHEQLQKDVKSKLPRRDSERRNHPLAKRFAVLNWMKLELSTITAYKKYINMNLCCFIPGKVLDEALHVLEAVSKSESLPHEHELLRELRDLSQMAVEHFQENIVPRLKTKMPPIPQSPSANSPGCSVAQGSNTTALVTQQQDPSTEKARADADKASNLEQGKQFVELQQQLAETKKQVQEQKGQIMDLNRRMDEQDKKIMELMEDNAQLKRGRKTDSPNAGGEEQSEKDRKSGKRKSTPPTGVSDKRSKLMD